MDPDSPASDEIRRFEEQYERQPGSLVFARLADAYRKAGEPERALTVLEDGLLRHPDYPSGHIVMARTLRDLGRVDETLQSFRRVLELDGANLVAIRELAGLADERGDVAEARHWYERLAHIDSADPEVRRRLADLEAAVAAPSSAGAAAEDGAGAVGTEPAEVSADEEGPSSWWDDSAVALPTAPPGVPSDVEGEPDPEDEEALDEEMRPEDEAVEAILNGAVPLLVRAEDTWWYEEVSDSEEPAPSKDADLLTRTMADLYAEQGLRREAAEIYQELLRDAPGDPELLARLEALRAEEPPSVKVVAGHEGPQAGDVEPGAGASDSAAGGGPVPLGRPKGIPWLDELRRLLRTGEEHAGSLGEVEPVPSPGGPSAGAEAAGSGEAPVEEGSAEGDASDETGRFLRDWIQGLEADA